MFILRWVAEMNEFCGLVNITLGRSPEGEFLVSRRETMKLLHRGWVVAHTNPWWAHELGVVFQACNGRPVPGCGKHEMVFGGTCVRVTFSVPWV